jgi:phospholipase/carboxylesterase
MPSRSPGSLSAVVALLALVASSGCERKDAAMETRPAAEPPRWVERVLQPRETIPGPPPLVVLLHGIGADENDLFPIAPRLDPRVTVVSLRAPRMYHLGYAWFQIDFRSDGSVIPDVAGARTTLAELVRWLEAAPARLGTDPRRTFLVGFSQGAMMSLGVLRTVPERIAGVVALSGRSAEGLFEAPASREEIARVPLFVAHGTYDTVLPIENGRQTRAAFASLSGDFTYREFPVDHGIHPDELAAVADWLSARISRVRPTP